MGEAKNREKLAQKGGATRSVQSSEGARIVLDPPVYRQYIQPHGWLTADVPCHALFHYYVTASEVWKSEKEAIKYEGDKSKVNLHQLWLSIAQLYGVDPNDMARYWPPVDLQAGALGLTKLPKGTDLGVNWRDPKRGLS
jgi:hypothetical protein